MASVELKSESGKLYVTLNRPENHNAFNPQMIDELIEAFQTPSIDKTLRVIVLSGNGKSFCSGADLEWMKSMAKYSLDENMSDSRRLFELFESAKDCPCPIVGKLHGNVFGGALGLAAVCDIALSVEGTKFCFSEVKLGLAPAVISPFVLKKVKKSLAREWMLTGKLFTPEEAKESGLVNYVGSHEEVDKAVEKIVSRIMASGPEAVRETKQLLNMVERSLWVEMKEMTASVIAERRVSFEGQSGLKSFFEKSKPPWLTEN